MKSNKLIISGLLIAGFSVFTSAMDSSQIADSDRKIELIEKDGIKDRKVVELKMSEVVLARMKGYSLGKQTEMTAKYEPSKQISIDDVWKELEDSVTAPLER